MYRIKNGVELKTLEKYGFKIGNNIPDSRTCISKFHHRYDYWLIPVNPNNPSKPIYASEGFDDLLWSIHVQSNRKIHINCVPSGSFEIDNNDMEEMFYVLKCMIEDGIIEDDYER